MVDALCNLENIPKHCMKLIGTERSHNYIRLQELKRASLFIELPFCTAGCFIQVLSN